MVGVAAHQQMLGVDSVRGPVPAFAQEPPAPHLHQGGMGSNAARRAGCGCRGCAAVPVAAGRVLALDKGPDLQHVRPGKHLLAMQLQQRHSCLSRLGTNPRMGRPPSTRTGGNWHA